MTLTFPNSEFSHEFELSRTEVPANFESNSFSNSKSLEIVILEFSKVDNEILSWLYDKYSFNLIPFLGEIVTNDRDSYQYLIESIRKFPDQEDFLDMIKTEGFKQVRFRNLSFGVAALHSAWKI